jgi:acyl-CoA synthetase (NDP forming)
VDVAGLPLELEPVLLERFFSPRSMAVIGASDTEGRPNTAIFRRLREWAEARGAAVRPVNPTKATVDGLPCVPSILDVEGDLDLAVLLVGDPLDVLEDVVAKGPAFAVVFAAGFAETGDEGRRNQEHIAELLATGTVRLLGPNTNLNAFESFRTDLAGPSIALISQSGHQGRPIFQAQELGIALSHWAPTGNEVDLEFADFARWFADQPGIGVVAAYVEGFKDGRTLRLAADHAAAMGTPLVVVKVGRTEAGASMARSHTGKLTGSDAVMDGVFRQHGVHRVDGLDELLDTSQLLARAGRPTGDGVCIYSISGGTGAHMADLCAAGGLRLPQLSAATQEALHQWIPPYLRVSNPVDNGGHPVGDWRGRKILETLCADPDVDVLICPITGAFPPMSDNLAKDLVAVAEGTDTVICVIWGSPVGDEEAYREILLSSSKLAVFRTFGNCVTAVRHLLDHHRFVERYRSPFPGAPRRRSRAAGPARQLMEGRDALSEWDAKRLLAAYGIATPNEELVSTPAEAVRAARRIGYPVALKACGAGLEHKSDLGLVRLDLRRAEDVKWQADELLDAAPGVLVSEMVSGLELVVGVARDQLFGPTVMVGIGGVLVEVLGDVSFRVPPFDRAEARRMLEDLRGYPILRGVRGRPPADVDAVLDVIGKVQRLSLELADDIAELDINPLLVRPAGGGAVALDALVVPAARS